MYCLYIKVLLVITNQKHLYSFKFTFLGVSLSSLFCGGFIELSIQFGFLNVYLLSLVLSLVSFFFYYGIVCGFSNKFLILIIRFFTSWVFIYIVVFIIGIYILACMNIHSCDAGSFYLIRDSLENLYRINDQLIFSYKSIYS